MRYLEYLRAKNSKPWVPVKKLNWPGCWCGNKFRQSSLIFRYYESAQCYLLQQNASDTAMSRLVGLPLAIFVKLMMQGKFSHTGVNIPIMKEAYEPVIEELKEYGVHFIEKDEKAECPWIIFTIEAPSFKNDKTPESQLWYIVQGKQALYTNFRAVKQATVPADLKDKWIKFFKAGKIVNK